MQDGQQTSTVIAEVVIIYSNEWFLHLTEITLWNAVSINGHISVALSKKSSG